MKSLLAILLFITSATFAQTEDSTKYVHYKFQYGSWMPRFWADTLLRAPYGDTAVFPKPQKPGAIMMHTDKVFYKWTGTAWATMEGSGGGGSADSSIFATLYRLDTAKANLRAEIAAGGSCTPAGSNTQIQYTNSGAFGAEAAFTYEPSINRLTSDTVLTRKIRIPSDSTTLDYEVVFNPTEANPLDSAVNFNMLYSSARVNPMSTRPNWVWSAGMNLDNKIVGDGNMRIGFESHYGQFGTYNWEFHVPEIQLPNGDIRRPASLLFPKSNSPYSQWIYEASTYLFRNSLATLDYGSLAEHRHQLMNYADSAGDNHGLFEFETTTRTGIKVGGFKMDSYYSGTTEKMDWTMYSKNWQIGTPGGLWINSSAAPADGGFGRNYIFNVNSGNSTPIMWVGKDWGGSYSQAFEVQNNGNTVFGPINEPDKGYKLQAVGNSAFQALADNDDTATVTYPVAITKTIPTLNVYPNAGFGVGLKLRGENNVNTIKDLGAIESKYTDTADGTEDADMIFRQVRAGALAEGLKIQSTGNVIFNSAYKFPSVSGTNGQTLVTDGSGNITWQTPSTGTTYTFTNGLTNSSGTVGWGGSFSGTRTLTGSTNSDKIVFTGAAASTDYFTRIAASGASGATDPKALQVDASAATNGIAIQAIGGTGSTGRGIMATGGEYGMNGLSLTGAGLVGNSYNNSNTEPGVRAIKTGASGTGGSVLNGFDIRRETIPTVANNIGVRQTFTLPQVAGYSSATEFISQFTNVTGATLRSRFTIRGVYDSVFNDILVIEGNGNTQITGGVYGKVTTITSNTTLTGNENVILVSATGGNVTVTLPSASSVFNSGNSTGVCITLKRTDGSVNTVSISGTIDGAGSYPLSAQYKYVTIVSNGTDWSVVGNN